jgi:Ferritin-like
VVAHREHLWWLLAEAAQLEHMIMCQYLFAEFSLKDSPGEGLTDEQADAVGRWRKTLRGIAVEEMLHVALVANLMAAIGAAPTLGRPNFPQRSGYFPSGVLLDLLPFGEQALRHFLYLERPEGMERQDADGFVPTAPPREPVAADELLPRGQEFATIGHLYRGIADGLHGLAERFGERAVFVGSPRAQATPELFRWPQLIAVTDLASALAAVEEIIEQGEGAAATGAPPTTAGSSPSGSSTRRSGSVTRRLSRPARSCPSTPASRSTSPPRGRSSPIRWPTTSPSWPGWPTRWCCRCLCGSSPTPTRPTSSSAR